MSGIMGEKSGDRCEDGECTAEDFVQFYSDKVDSIRSATSATPLQDISDTASHAINEWTPVTALEVEKLIRSSFNRTSQLDPAPTWLIKELRTLQCCHHSLPFSSTSLWRLVVSQESTDMPSCFRYSKRTAWTQANRRTSDQSPTCRTFRSYLKESCRRSCSSSSTTTT